VAFKLKKNEVKCKVMKRDGMIIYHLQATSSGH